MCMIIKLSAQIELPGPCCCVGLDEDSLFLLKNTVDLELYEHYV